jgi:hypothetical protein
MRDEQWPVARLIPISSASRIEAQERRAGSALLAVLAHVEEFGRALLKPLDAPGGGRIESFVEVPFKVEKAQDNQRGPGQSFPRETPSRESQAGPQLY